MVYFVKNFKDFFTFYVNSIGKKGNIAFRGMTLLAIRLPYKNTTRSERSGFNPDFALENSVSAK